MYIPEGFSTVTPYIFAQDAANYAVFLGAALGAVELGRSTAPDGRIANCQVRIGDTTVMLSDASDAFPPSHAAFYLYVANAEEAMRRAIEAGAVEIMAVADMPYGDRQGGVSDLAGNIWWISQRLTAAPYF